MKMKSDGFSWQFRPESDDEISSILSFAFPFGQISYPPGEIIFVTGPSDTVTKNVPALPQDLNISDT